MSNAKLALPDMNRPTNIGGLQVLGRAMLKQIEAAAPRMMKQNAERVVRCLLTECNQTPKLLDCTPASLFGAVLRATQLGLEIGGPAGQAYVLPFGGGGKGTASLVIGYKGFVQLVHRSNLVRRLTPREVRAADHFEIEYGSNQRIVHRPNLSAAGVAAEVIGYYCVVEMTSGGSDFEYMTVEQMQAHRARFALMKNGGPWQNNFDEMAKKTVLRKIVKRLPLSPELVSAATLDEQGEEGIDQQLPAAVMPDEPPPDGASDLEDEIARIEARETAKS